MDTASPAHRPGPLVFAVLGAWLLAALGLVLTGTLASLPRPVIPVLVLGPPIAYVAALVLRPALRSRVAAWDPRWAILWHGVRAPIGVAFLVFEARGRLPAAFAIPAGWGDLVVGLAAIGAARCVPMTTRERRGMVAVFNVAGAFDILAVIATAQFLLLVRPTPGMEMLASSPWGLIPAFVVPLVLIAHATTFVQLAATRRHEHRRATDRA